MLGNAVNPNGSPTPEANGKIVMSIYGLASERQMANLTPVSRMAASESFAVSAAPLLIDVRLMFYANFTGEAYATGLAALSRLIAFFQANPSFTTANAVQLAPAIERLTLEIEDLSAADLDHLMHMSGLRYLPSAFYQIRTLPFTTAPQMPATHPVLGMPSPAG